MNNKDKETEKNEEIKKEFQERGFSEESMKRILEGLEEAKKGEFVEGPDIDED